MNDDAVPDADGTPPAAVRLHGHAEYAQAALKLITRAHLQLRLLSPQLDPRAWSHPGVIELLRSFALRSPHAQIRILVQQPQRVAQTAHRLVELARRLPSRIAMHELGEAQRGLAEEFAVADEYAVLRKRRHDDADALWFAHAPPEARLMRRRFDALWDESLPARELAELRI